jgi:hypothetical protein
VPLRAKVAVSIKGQDPRWTYTPAPGPTAGNGAGNQPGGAPSPQGGTALPPGAPGTQGNGLSPDRIVQALPGESLAQLASRAGFDPAAWRALADGLANPLRLELGQEVPLPASAGKGAATGLAAQGSEPAKTATMLPLVSTAQATASGEGSSDATRNTRPAAADPVRQGQAVASQGGLQGAIAQIKKAAHQQGAGASLAAFGFDAGASADAGDRPWGMGVPLRPRFGSRQGGARRDPTQAPGVSLATASPLRPARMPRTSRRGGGCGCRDCQGRHKH